MKMKKKIIVFRNQLFKNPRYLLHNNQKLYQNLMWCTWGDDV